jgi:hypothetical protein
LRRQPSLRSQLNQIRLWVRQGRTNAWIAHKLDVSIEQLERFKRDHDLEGDSAAVAPPADPLSVPPPGPESYMPPDEDEDEEPGAPEEADEAEEMVRPRPQRQRRPPRSRDRDGGQREPRGRDDARERAGGRPPQADEEDEDSGQPRRSRRRGRRGGRRRRRPSTYEATFDHGEDGYGLWLDPAVVDNPVYAEHWAGQRAVVVVFDRDTITIRRAGAESPNGAEDVEPDADADGDRNDQE